MQHLWRCQDALCAAPDLEFLTDVKPLGSSKTWRAGPHTVAQRWSRGITEAFPEPDGVRYTSRFAGRPCIALFAPAATAMPARPVLSLPLTHPGLACGSRRQPSGWGYLVV